MLPSISPQEVLAALQAGSARLIDIRESDEFSAVHIPGSRSLPLSLLAAVPDYPLCDSPCGACCETGRESGCEPGHEAAQKLIFTCRSGHRTKEAAAMLAARALPDAGLSVSPDAAGTCFMLEGGLLGWEQAGLPLVREARPVLPLFRQIQIGAGLLVLLGTVGSLVWAPLFWLAVFVGAGLVFAGVSGFCGLGILLSKMPWNQKTPVQIQSAPSAKPVNHVRADTSANPGARGSDARPS